MLVPTNPRDHDVLWAALEAALRQADDFYVVEGGALRQEPGGPWTDDRVAHFVAALKARPLRFVSARHGQPLAPHFAVELSDDGATAVLVELVSMRFRGDGDRPAFKELLRDVGVVAAALSTARPSCRTLKTPLRQETDALPEGYGVDDDGTIVVDVRAF